MNIHTKPCQYLTSPVKPLLSVMLLWCLQRISWHWCGPTVPGHRHTRDTRKPVTCYTGHQGRGTQCFNATTMLLQWILRVVRTDEHPVRAWWVGGLPEVPDATRLVSLTHYTYTTCIVAIVSGMSCTQNPYHPCTPTLLQVPALAWRRIWNMWYVTMTAPGTLPACSQWRVSAFSIQHIVLYRLYPFLLHIRGVH